MPPKNDDISDVNENAEGAPRDDEIRDPQAYARAQRDIAQRALSQRDEMAARLDELTARLDEMTKTQQESTSSLQSRIEAHRQAAHTAPSSDPHLMLDDPLKQRPARLAQGPGDPGTSGRPALR